MILALLLTLSAHAANPTPAPVPADAFAKLQAAQKKFRDVRVENEVDAAKATESEIQDRDFQESLRTFAQGQTPKLERKKEDAKLNDTFKKILKVDEKKKPWGTVTRNGIIKGQKAWLEYRLAWKVYAGAEKADLVDAWITNKRTLMLEPLLTGSKP